MSSPILSGSSQDVKSINIRDGTNNGQTVTTGIDSAGNIIEETEYDGTSIVAVKNLYYASFKLLDDLDTIGNWVGSGDEDSTAVNSGGWLDSTTDVLRVTYTYGTGTCTITDATTNHGDISDYIGAGCDEGYVMIIMKYSDFSNVTALQLKIGDSSANYRYLSLSGSAVSNSWVSNDVWVGLVFDLSTGTDTGTPDGTAVDYIQLNWTVAAGTSKTIDIKDLYICKEITTEISGNDFYSLRRQRIALSYEGKTVDTEYVYESENESILFWTKSGGY